VFLLKAYEELGGDSCAIESIGLKVKFLLTTTMKQVAISAKKNSNNI
jgi:hypothetical protein